MRTWNICSSSAYLHWTISILQRRTTTRTGRSDDCCLSTDLPSLRLDHASVAHSQKGSGANSRFRVCKVPCAN